MLKPRFKENIVLSWNLVIWVPCYLNLKTNRYEDGYNGRLLEGEVKNRFKVKNGYFETGMYGYLVDSGFPLNWYYEKCDDKSLSFLRGVIKAGNPFDYGKFWSRDIVFSELVTFPEIDG